MDRIETATREFVDALRAEVVAVSVRETEPDRLLAITDAADVLGIGRSMLYEEISRGRIRTVKVGRRRLVPAGAIREYIDDSAATSA